jgi:acyl-CoA reductase-like NAD-dependent aldehyde dehydrogenase
LSIQTETTFVGHFIDGAEVPSRSGRTFACLNPTTAETIATVAFGEPADVDLAVASAKTVFRSGAWSRLTPGRRAAIMRRLADLIRDDHGSIAEIESRDTGKPIAQTRTEVLRAADRFSFFAALAELPNGHTHPADDGYFVYSIREPYGVVGAIAPWNFPFVSACAKTAPALAVGNSVVLKMAEQTPLSSSVLARLALAAGMPAGVLNVVHGDGPSAGAALVAHPDVRKLTFTGSTVTGQAILRSAADQVKSVHLELGGKSPNIVFDDADIDQAIAGSIYTAFYNAGQICTSGSRLLVQRNLVEPFVERLVDRARKIKIGLPDDPDTQLGPLISAEQLERVSSYIEAGRSDGARLVTGGGRPSFASGYFIEPTVFMDVTPDMRIAREEIFGPVLSVMPFDDEDEAVRLANDVMYGLAATVWTNDIGRAFRMAERIDAGLIWTNSPHYLPVHIPFEGHKMSGIGEDLGVEAMNTFTQLKTHTINFGGARHSWA